MTVNVAVELRNDGLDAQLALVVSGKLRAYTGSRPANADASATGTLLWEYTMDSAPFDAAASGAAAANGLPWEANAGAVGTIGYVRMTKTNGTDGAYDFTATATGGGGDVEFDTLTVSAIGQPLRCTGLTLNQP